jgi:DNA-binding NtrC family response regulator
MATILVVERDYHVARCIGEMLRIVGHEPKIALNDSDAIALFAHRDIDVVLIDAGASAADGSEVVALCRHVDPAAACIMMCSVDALAAEEVRRIGAASQIEKPFTIGRLSREISAAIKRKRRLCPL